MFIATGFSDIDVEVDLNICDIDIINGWIVFYLLFFGRDDSESSFCRWSRRNVTFLHIISSAATTSYSDMIEDCWAIC